MDKVFVKNVMMKLLKSCSRLGPVVGVSLVGSQADGTADESSDYDFFVLRHGPPSRGLMEASGFQVEWFVESPESVIQEVNRERLLSFRPLTHMWTGARPLYDPVGVVNHVIQCADQVAKKPPSPLKKEDLLVELVTLQAIVEDAVREHSQGRFPSFEFLASRTIDNGIQLIYRRHGRVMPKPRQLADDLRAFEPNLASALERYGQAGREERKEAFSRVAARIVKLGGGPVKMFDIDRLAAGRRSHSACPRKLSVEKRKK